MLGRIDSSAEDNCMRIEVLTAVSIRIMVVWSALFAMKEEAAGSSETSLRTSHLTY
jgi:hypothetical protein